MTLSQPRCTQTARPSRRRSLTSGVALLVMTAASACSFGATGTDADNDDGGTAPAPPRTSITFATPYAITDLNPAMSGFWAPEFGYGELLMRAREDGSFEPWVLESLAATSDTTWLLTLHDGVTFQNGNPLDADTLSTLINAQLDSNSDLAAQVPGGTTRAVSDLEVELTTSTPAGTVPAAFANESLVQLYDLEAAEAAGEDVEAQIDAKFWTGPFVVTGITSELMTLQRNEDYWGGVPHLETVSLKFIPDAQARVLAVQSGEADLALYPEASSARSLEGASDATFIAGAEPRASVRMLLNLQDPPLRELEVRQALSLGLDYAEIGQQVLPGVYEVATGMFPANLPFAVATQETNVDEANQILDAAGWARGSSEYREKDGNRLQVTFVLGKEIVDLQTMALAMQDQLREVGIEVKIQEVDDVYETTAENGWSATFLFSTPFGNNYVGETKRFLASDGAVNLGHIADPELDALLDDALAQTDTGAQYDLLRQIQEHVVANVYNIFPAERRSSAVAGSAWGDYVVPVDNLWVDMNTGLYDS